MTATKRRLYGYITPRSKATNRGIPSRQLRATPANGVPALPYSTEYDGKSYQILISEPEEQDLVPDGPAANLNDQLLKPVPLNLEDKPGWGNGRKKTLRRVETRKKETRSNTLWRLWKISATTYKSFRGLSKSLRNQWAAVPMILRGLRATTLTILRIPWHTVSLPFRKQRTPHPIPLRPEKRLKKESKNRKMVIFLLIMTSSFWSTAFPIATMEILFLIGLSCIPIGILAAARRYWKGTLGVIAQWKGTVSYLAIVGFVMVLKMLWIIEAAEAIYTDRHQCYYFKGLR
ncbi:hypothetical protein TWF569_009840 [Orbilia oligospora]|uniref:Uncharacterized protein n=1 Tax=Orbilia oligospora TaxID=2813651 RepID=A0A7C8JN45_ORBOL|nr:hypothetical protein TWF706_006653 [Orbilia oligospora]KAF3112701.1 hypothetical protein TWF102_004100 [Orbilia oligospora]KAF3117627.1 hypothetical protein TWF103_004312 [Orbilia oligospora]KAF3142854.1 hypothetical protein TWF703_000358 [Orbilia oligospora]KAF3152083.1 hypothetical protein TWF594_005835 [Orbilia oligospora]